MRWYVALALWGAALGGGLAPAAAQEEGESEARMHFRVGRAYYDSGRFLEAAREFEEAYRLSDRPALLYNIFVAYRDAGRTGPAIDALRRYLELEPNIDNRDQLTARLAAMERVYAQQQEAGTAGGGNDGGGEDTGDGGAPAPEATDAGAATGDPAATPPPASGGGGGGTWTPGWIIAGVGAAAVVASVITGVLALDHQSRLQNEYNCVDGLCDPGFEGVRDSGALLAGLTDGLLFGGLAIAATGVVLALVLSDGGSDDRAAFGVSCGPTGCLGALRGSFR